MLRALRHRDFRLLWLGALLSFTGSWVQQTAQQWLVFDLTHSEAMLGLVSFCGSAPVAIFGPVAGLMADLFNKKTLLVVSQTIFALGSLFLAITTYTHHIQFWHIVMIATIAGITSCVEMPARQSTVGQVVPAEDLASAIPLQAMTFNLARILGPAVGGVLLIAFGVAACYFINSASYIFLIVAALAIRTNLASMSTRAQPVRDLLMEGMRFTFRDARLRTLFVMEVIVSTFGLPYLALMAAIAKKMLNLDKSGLGIALSFIGIGALAGLLIVAKTGTSRTRSLYVRIAMTVLSIGLVGLSIAPNPTIAFGLLVVLGMCAITQFNTTNTLFQLIAPENLRGRVIAMHIWALSGMGPFGTLFFGWLASRTSIPLVLQIGGICVFLGAIWAWTQKHAFKDMP